MLDEVAIYLVAAPLILTAGIIGAIAVWFSRERVAALRVARKRRHPEL